MKGRTMKPVKPVVKKPNPSPDAANSEIWWTDSDTFASGPFFSQFPQGSWSPWQDGLFDWGTLAQSEVGFLTHCPVNKEFIECCHRLGIRCFPYVSFYFGSAKASFGNIESQTYEGVKWADHTDWFARLSQLSTDPTPWEFGSVTDGVGVSFPHTPPDPGTCVVCPNVQGYHDKMKAWVEYVMSQGADGLFVDNLGAGLGKCWGAQQGIHNHIIPDDPANPGANQKKAFAMLLQKVRAVVKQHRPDGLILGNSGDPLGLPQEVQESIDSDMLEGYICGSQGNSIVQYATRSSQQWDQYGQELQAYRNQGKQVLVISPLGSARGIREGAFLCYASARLAGFIWLGGMVGGIPMSHPQVADLYRLQLGKPLTGELSQGAIRYCVFERGLVAVNLDGVNAGNLTIQSTPIPTTYFQDLFPDSPNQPNIKVSVPGGALPIPASSGRIYLFGSTTDYGLNRLT